MVLNFIFPHKGTVNSGLFLFTIQKKVFEYSAFFDQKSCTKTRRVLICDNQYTGGTPHKMVA